MKAYDVGKREAGTRKDRYRRYQSTKAENDYWRGYIDEMRSRLKPEQMLVQCEREGTIFPVDKDSQSIVCPTCGRCYIKEGDSYESDRKLTLL